MKTYRVPRFEKLEKPYCGCRTIEQANEIADFFKVDRKYIRTINLKEKGGKIVEN